jgi:hypothetical protein
MAIEARDIPELKILKPTEHKRVMCDIFALRQGIQPKSPHPVACEMAERVGPDYQIIALERAFQAVRSFSSSDIPEVLEYAINQLPAPPMKPLHRKFCKLDSVQSFKDVEYIKGLDDLPVQDAAELEEVDAQPIVFESPINARLKNFRSRLVVSRRVWINNQKWLESSINAMRTAFYRKEAALVYDALEAGTPAHTEPSASLQNVALAVEKFRGLTTSTGELIGAEPKYFICPASSEVLAKEQIKLGGLNIEVISRSGLSASYLLPDPEEQAAITLQVLGEKGEPLIETKRPSFSSDNVALLDGLHNVNAVFTSGLCVVKLVPSS